MFRTWGKPFSPHSLFFITHLQANLQLFRSLLLLLLLSFQTRVTETARARMEATLHRIKGLYLFFRLVRPSLSSLCTVLKERSLFVGGTFARTNDNNKVRAAFPDSIQIYIFIKQRLCPNTMRMKPFKHSRAMAGGTLPYPCG